MGTISKHRPGSNTPNVFPTETRLSGGVDARRIASLDGSARDEEPLVVNSINRFGSQVLMSGDFEGAGIHTVWGMRDGPVGPIAALISR